MKKIAEDIISLPIEINPKMADSKFRLVHIASQRVRELSAGEPPLVTSRSIKDTTVALEEAIAERFTIIVGDAAITAKEEFRKREEQAKMDAQLSAKEEEIRKELSAYLSESADEEEAGEPVEENLDEEESVEEADTTTEDSEE